MTEFKPFADDSAVLSIGELVIENGTQSIAFHGSLDITRDQKGLEKARALQSAINEIVGALETDRNLADELPAQKRSTKTFDNPFGIDQ